MKSWLKPIMIFVSIIGILGIVAMLTGIIPISASGGHWPITRWFLELAKERSLSTYSLLVKEKKLLNPDMVMQGAGHYEIGCRQCHGGAENSSFIGLQSTPKASFLPERVKKWEPDELFRIVKHGIKFTGMPAWPVSTRDDEVWSMVAFLKKLPELNSDSYGQLVYGGKAPSLPPSSPLISEDTRLILMKCANCHGVDGNGRSAGAFPKLAGQNEHYLNESLKSYRSGERNSGTMQLMAYALEDDMIRELSRYYNSLPRTPGLHHEDFKSPEISAAIKRGQQIASRGIPEQKVAACMGCHGPDENGKTLKPHFPDLRGQPVDYLVKQLSFILEDKRGGSHNLHLMKKAVPKLTNEQRKDVSLYYHSIYP